MTRKSIRLILMLIACTSLLFKTHAQVFESNEDLFEEAENYLIGEEYKEALPIYRMLLNKGMNNANIQYKTGICCLNIPGKKGLAIKHFKMASAYISKKHDGTFSDSVAPQKTLYYLGIAYRIDNNIDSAIKYFEEYRSLVEGSELVGLVDYHIRICNNSKFLQEQEPQISLKSLSITDKYSIYNPLIVNNELYGMEVRPFYDAIIKSDFAPGQRMLDVENLTPQLKSDGEHVLTSVSDNGQLLLFTSFNSDSLGQLSYATLKDNGKWSRISSFPPAINSLFDESFVSINKAGNKILFTSNRSEGFGGYDIYMSQLDASGQWSKPINMGDKVNTALNEYSPFFSNDGSKIYFSSQGHLGMGGYDHFVTSIDSNGICNEALNLGVPLSTTDDDMFLSPGEDSGFAYTYKPNLKNGKLDVYQVTFLTKEPVKKILLKGKLQFNENIPAKAVEYKVINTVDSIEVMSGETTPDGIFQTYLPLGKYLLKYSYDSNYTASQYINLNSASFADELIIDEPDWESEKKIVRVKLMVKNILFPFNSTEIENEYHAMLDTIIYYLKSNTQIAVDISGHTDALGDAVYNQILSEKRAMAVRNYLLNGGAEPQQLNTKAYGEEKPAAINKNSDGTDNQKGRAYNRRVEIVIQNTGTLFEIYYQFEIPDELKILDN